MKQKLICIFLAFLLLLTGCGSSTQVNLQEPVPIPEDGMVSQSIVKQLQSENAIATFQGTSNGFPYEWTVFGSDITEAKAVNLRTEIQQTGEGIQVSFSQEEPFGFPALLSVQLQDTWA